MWNVRAEGNVGVVVVKGVMFVSSDADGTAMPQMEGESGAWQEMLVVVKVLGENIRVSVEGLHGWFQLPSAAFFIFLE